MTTVNFQLNKLIINAIEYKVLLKNNLLFMDTSNNFNIFITSGDLF